MAAEEGVPPLVVDCGSGMCKAGYAGVDDMPRATFPTVVGRLVDMPPGFDDKFVGYQALYTNETMDLQYPVEHGIVTDWDNMEKVWSHVFENELCTETQQHNVLLTEAPLNPKESREKAAQIMFETFGASGMQLAIQAVLSLRSSGRTTGLVLESGDGVTYAVPVHNGCAVDSAVLRLDVGGKDLKDHLVKILEEKGHSFNSPREQFMLNDIKERMCYVSVDYKKDLEKTHTGEPYGLPGGELLELTTERFRCPEALFQPSMIGREGDGIHKMAHVALTKADAGLRKDMYGNVVLGGGSTMFPGLAERLEKDLTSLAPEGTAVKVIAREDRIFSAFLGGCLLAAQPTFKEKWVTKAEYGESGPSAIHRKLGLEP